MPAIRDFGFSKEEMGEKGRGGGFFWRLACSVLLFVLVTIGAGLPEGPGFAELGKKILLDGEDWSGRILHPEMELAQPASAAALPTELMSLPLSGVLAEDYAAGQNTGIRITAAEGAEVKAAATGVVRDLQKTERGWQLSLWHNASVCTVYAGLAELAVQEGETVAQGEPLGSLGDSALSFSVCRDGVPCDPWLYLSGGS